MPINVSLQGKSRKLLEKSCYKGNIAQSCMYLAKTEGMFSYYDRNKTYDGHEGNKLTKGVKVIQSAEKKACELKYPDACAMLSDRYKYGWSVKKDSKKSNYYKNLAIKYYKNQ